MRQFRRRLSGLLRVAAVVAVAGPPAASGEGAAHGSPAVGWIRHHALEEPSLRRLEESLEPTADGLPAGRPWVEYRYGDGDYVGAGQHRAAFVNGVLDTSVLEEARQLALSADREEGWALTGGASGVEGRELKLRCALVVEYVAAPGGSDFAEESGTRGWREGGATLLSLALPLDAGVLEAVEGGELEVRRRGGGSAGPTSWRADAQRGDACVWRGWDEHRVLPLQRGRRRMLVLEWWLGPEASPDVPRRPDDVVELRRVLPLDPASPVLQLGLAMALAREGQPEEAAAAFREAISSDPEWERAHGEFAASLALRGALAEAEGLFRAAVELRPESLPARKGLGQVHLDRGSVAEAREHFAEAASLNPADARLLSQLGSLQETPLEADAWLHRAVQLDPLDAVVRHRLGVFQAQSGDLGSAEDSLRESVRIDPASLAHYDLGVLYSSQERGKDALVAYKAAAALSPGDVRVHVNMGLLRHRLGKRKGADKSFRAALALDPGDTKALMGLADLQVDRDDPTAALATLRRAVEVRPGDVAPRTKLGLLLWSTDREALQQEEEEEREQPPDAEGRPRFAEAEHQLRIALELAPESDKAHFNLGLVHKDQGRPEAARELFQRAVELNPVDEEYSVALEDLDDEDEEEDEEEEEEEELELEDDDADGPEVEEIEDDAEDRVEPEEL